MKTNYNWKGIVGTILIGVSIVVTVNACDSQASFSESDIRNIGSEYDTTAHRTFYAISSIENPIIPKTPVISLTDTIGYISEVYKFENGSFLLLAIKMRVPYCLTQGTQLERGTDVFGDTHRIKIQEKDSLDCLNDGDTLYTPVK